MIAVRRAVETVGRATLDGIREIGLGATLFAESLYWLFLGPRRDQPVRLDAVFVQMMRIGIEALPIVTVLAATVGMMLAIQGIYTLRQFGAEEQVVLGIALSVTREFAPLVTGILVAGRSGSALAARLGTMTVNQEIDALVAMGINPVRFLVVPALLAMVVMLPALTFWADIVALGAAGLYVAADIGISLAAYGQELLLRLALDDLLHGLTKSAIFAVLIALIGVMNGAAVRGGAEGVGLATTRAVVHAISAIVVTDMIFVFVITRT